MRRSYFALFAIMLIVLGAHALFAKTYYVGSCKAGAYTSIQAAVSAVPAGSIIQVCAGTYYEQIVISQALTLEAIPNGAPVTISANGVTLVPTASLAWSTVDALIQVNAGSVNITGITVDGAYACPINYAIGIFYSSGSSGTIKGVDAINQGCQPYFSGMGIVVESDAMGATTVTIENSYIAGNKAFGIFAMSYPPATLTIVVKNNYLTGNSWGIYPANFTTQGSVSNNFIANGTTGVFADAGGVVVAGNWISNQTFAGIDIEAPAVSVSSNQIFDSATGIYLSSLNSGGVTAKSNTITNSPVGIEFNCATGNTVTANTINAATTGLDRVPPAQFTGLNKLYNVGTTTTGCQ